MHRAQRVSSYVVQNQLLPEHNDLLIPKHSPSLSGLSRKAYFECISLPREISISVVDLPVFRKLITSQNYRASLEFFPSQQSVLLQASCFAFLWQVFRSTMHRARSCLLRSACKGKTEIVKTSFNIIRPL